MAGWRSNGKQQECLDEEEENNWSSQRFTGNQEISMERMRGSKEPNAFKDFWIERPTKGLESKNKSKTRWPLDFVSKLETTKKDFLQCRTRYSVSPLSVLQESDPKANVPFVQIHSTQISTYVVIGEKKWMNAKSVHIALSSDWLTVYFTNKSI